MLNRKTSMKRSDKPIKKRRAKRRLAEVRAGTSEFRLDEQFSEIIRSRGYCEAQGYQFACSGPLQCSHRKNRHHTATQWDEDNADCFCDKHHKHFEKNDKEYRDFVGHEKWDELEFRCRQAMPDLGDVRKRLSARLKEFAW